MVVRILYYSYPGVMIIRKKYWTIFAVWGKYKQILKRSKKKNMSSAWLEVNKGDYSKKIICLSLSVNCILLQKNWAETWQVWAGWSADNPDTLGQRRPVLCTFLGCHLSCLPLSQERINLTTEITALSCVHNCLENNAYNYHWCFNP